MPRPSSERLPIVLVPGLACSARLYSDQIPVLWPFGPVTFADHTRGETIAAIARSILGAAPPRFVLLGLSMGGYIAFEIMRQAPERVAKLALLDTAATPETAQQTATRETRIELAKSGRFGEALDLMFPLFVHRDRHGDEDLKRIVGLMGEETGADAFIRQQHAIMARTDSRPSLAAIDVPRWWWSAMPTNSRRRRRRERLPPALRARAWSSSRNADTCRRWSGRKR